MSDPNADLDIPLADNVGVGMIAGFYSYKLLHLKPKREPMFTLDFLRAVVRHIRPEIERALRSGYSRRALSRILTVKGGAITVSALRRALDIEFGGGSKARPS